MRASAPGVLFFLGLHREARPAFVPGESQTPNMTTILLVLAALWTGDAGAVPSPVDRTAGKLAATVSKEMTEAIVALNKTLGLESWPARGVQPCLDRGGQGIEAKEVDARGHEEVRRLDDRQGIPWVGQELRARDPDGLDRSHHGDRVRDRAQNVGWAAYSCDPERKCLPVKLSAHQSGASAWPSGSRRPAPTRPRCGSPRGRAAPEEERARGPSPQAAVFRAVFPAWRAPARTVSTVWTISSSGTVSCSTSER